MTKYRIGWFFDDVLLCTFCLEDMAATENKTIQTIRDSNGNLPEPLYATDFYEDEDPTCHECGIYLFDN